MGRVRVGLIGRGTAGTLFHAPLIRAVPDLELAAVAGSDGAAALIGDAAIDLVVIATPNATHFPLARAALEAGKHVVVDKPFAVTVAEADALIALAAARGRVLSVFHNRRWDGDFLTVREILDSGALGEVMLYEAHWDRFRPAIKAGWREQAQGEGAGLLFDLGPHLIDQALVLFGTPDATAADVAVQRAGAVADDYFQLTLSYGPRRRVVLGASNLIAAPRPRFAVYGTKGALITRGLDGQEAALRAGASPGDPAFGAATGHVRVTRTGADGDGEDVAVLPGRWIAYYEAMVDAIRGRGPVPVAPADAAAGLRLIEAAHGARPGSRS
ncbi:MAG: oxidoreductase [Allosphingosinicella sp.]